MSITERAMMLEMRHRCGQQIHFWIPASLVAPIIGDLQEVDVQALSGWMIEEGMLSPAEQPDDLMAHLRRELAPRNIALIDVENDASVCPYCGTLLPWLEAVTEYVVGRNRGER